MPHSSDKHSTVKERGESTTTKPKKKTPLLPRYRIAPRAVVSRAAFYSTETKLDAPGSSKDVDPKIVSIVDQISGLTLLQTADLVSLLKVSPVNDNTRKGPGNRRTFVWAKHRVTDYTSFFTFDVPSIDPS